MPLLLKIIVLLVGGFYLVDQSQVVAESHSVVPSQEVCVANQCIENLANNADKTPLDPVSQNSSDSTNNSQAELRLNALMSQAKEEGIEGTGFRPTDEKYSLIPPRFVNYEDAMAEGGIEGTGIYGGFDEDPTLLEHNPDDDDDFDEGGIEGTGIVAGAENQLIAYGPITQFGSIYVNGTKYEIDDAELEFVNDTGRAELSIGMMVQVQADWQQQTNGVFNAQKVTFDHQIEGPINTIVRHGDVTLLNILGTTVVIAGDTAIDRSIPYQFDIGSVVTVSGISNEKNQLLATYIALRSDMYHEGQQVELENIVDEISVRDQIIRLNGMDVDVSQARWKKGSLETIEITTRVEIVGQYDVVTNRIIANQVRVKKNDLSLSKGNKLNVDTIVTHYDSISQFRVNGYTANASESEFLRGKPEGLRNGVRVRAAGYINIDGIFEVHTLRIKPNANFAVKAPVNSINPITGEIGFLNLKAYALPDTIYQSKLRSINKYFSINDIEVGDWIEIQGVEESGRLTISNLFALRDKPQMILKGRVSIDSSERFFLLGIDIQPTGSISPELISSVKDGGTIVAKGSIFDGNTFYARELIFH